MRVVRMGAAAGLSLTEAMLSLSIMLSIMVAFLRVMVLSEVASSTNHEVTLAKEAARSMIETLQAEPFDDVFASYNATGEDDPGVAGSAPGASFDVAGLDPRTNDADGRVGTVLFPTLSGAPEALREDAFLPQLGMPRDLNGDGNVDAVDHSGDYRLLPVIVRVEWRSATGASQLELKTMLGGL